MHIRSRIYSLTSCVLLGRCGHGSWWGAVRRERRYIPTRHTRNSVQNSPSEHLQTDGVESKNSGCIENKGLIGCEIGL